MRSILIISDGMFESYKRHERLFRDTADDVRVCFWRSNGTNIEAMVPDLYDAIGFCSEWNAYIVTDPFRSIEHIASEEERVNQRFVNPFDRVEGEKNAEELDADSLIRLTRCLGGSCDDSPKLIEKYAFRAARPRNIFLISPRIFEELENLRSETLHTVADDILCRVAQEQSSISAGNISGELLMNLHTSDFWYRNGYPSACRFIVFDFLSEKNIRYENSEFEFWLMVLSMTINELPATELGAYTLYRAELKMDEDSLRESMSAYYNSLTDEVDIARGSLKRIATLRETSYEAEQRDFVPERMGINVTFEDSKFDDLFGKKKGYGLSKDCPSEDVFIWRDNMFESRKALVKLFKNVNRGLASAAAYMRETVHKSFLSDRNIRITKNSEEDITEIIERKEIEMIRAETGYVVNKELIEKEHHQADLSVDRFMQTRLRKRETVIAGISATAIFLIGFIPFLVRYFQDETVPSEFAIALVLISCISFVTLCFPVLLLEFRKLMKHIESFNEIIRSIIKRFSVGANIFSEYLDNLAVYMRGFNLLHQHDNETERTEEEIVLTTNMRVFLLETEECKKIERFRNWNLNTDGKERISLSVNPNDLSVIVPHPAETYMDVNCIKNAIKAPYPFVRAIIFDKEELYE